MDLLLPLRPGTYQLKSDLSADSLVKRLNKAKLHSNLTIITVENSFKITDERPIRVSAARTRPQKIEVKGEIRDSKDGAIIDYCICVNDSQTSISLICYGIFLVLALVLGIGDLMPQGSPKELFFHLLGLPLGVLALYIFLAFNVDLAAQTAHAFLFNLQFECLDEQ